MNEQAKFEYKKEDTNGLRIRHLEKEALDTIIKEYQDDPELFYRKNAFELWDCGKNPALIVSVELMSQTISEIWQEQNLGDIKDAAKIINDAKNAAMFVMKYLGADIEGWCKVDPKTAVEINQKMGTEYNFKKNCQLILEDIKKTDPSFSEFLTKISVKDIETDQVRSPEQTMAIVETVALVARTMYEQMQKDSKKKTN